MLETRSSGRYKRKSVFVVKKKKKKNLIHLTKRLLIKHFLLRIRYQPDRNIPPSKMKNETVPTSDEENGLKIERKHESENGDQDNYELDGFVVETPSDSEKDVKSMKSIDDQLVGLGIEIPSRRQRTKTGASEERTKGLNMLRSRRAGKLSVLKTRDERKNRRYRLIDSEEENEEGGRTEKHYPRVVNISDSEEPIVSPPQKNERKSTDDGESEPDLPCLPKLITECRWKPPYTSGKKGMYNVESPIYTPVNEKKVDDGDSMTTPQNPPSTPEKQILVDVVCEPPPPNKKRLRNNNQNEKTDDKLPKKKRVKSSKTGCSGRAVTKDGGRKKASTSIKRLRLKLPEERVFR